MQHSCRQIAAGDLVESSRWRTVRSFFLFHLLRRYPAWAGWLPAHVPRLRPARSLMAEAHAETSTASATREGQAPAGADRVNQADPA
jgi:cardiolipin synthase